MNIRAYSKIRYFLQGGGGGVQGIQEGITHVIYSNELLQVITRKRNQVIVLRRRLLVVKDSFSFNFSSIKNTNTKSVQYKYY